MVMYPVLGRLGTVLAGHSQFAWMLLVAAGCAIIASIVAGLITYRLLERPITRFLQRKTRVYDPRLV
jgi:peptidoglycan/LPS O-acetylase OafA/YrhL